MALNDQIMADIKEAMKAKDAAKLTVFRALHARFSTALLEKKVAKGEDQVLSDEEMMNMVLNEAKKRKDSVAAYEEAGRPELAENEKAELDIISAYLPKQLSEEETRSEVEKIITASGASTLPEAMKAVMAELRGKADTKLVSEIIKSKFS